MRKLNNSAVSNDFWKQGPANFNKRIFFERETFCLPNTYSEAPDYSLAKANLGIEWLKITAGLHFLHLALSVEVDSFNQQFSKG